MNIENNRDTNNQQLKHSQQSIETQKEKSIKCQKYKIIKRKGYHNQANINDIYVQSKKHNMIYIKRVHTLFSKGIKNVFLHGLGVSILKCIGIALYLKEYYFSLALKIQTSSSYVINDLEPILQENQINECNKEQVQLKQRSAIHIQLIIQ